MICSDRPALSTAVRKEVIRCSTSVAIEVIDRSVRIIRTALDRNIDRTTRGITLLRIKHIRLYFEFLYRIGRRRETNCKIKRIVGRAVERDLVLRRCSVDAKSREV